MLTGCRVDFDGPHSERHAGVMFHTSINNVRDFKLNDKDGKCLLDLKDPSLFFTEINL